MTHAGLTALCLMAPLALGAILAPPNGVAASDGVAPITPAVSRCAGVRLELRTRTTPEGRPAFVATLINEGTETVTLVEPGDGSDVGWRTHRYLEGDNT